MDNDFRLHLLDERLHVLEAMQLASRRSLDLGRMMAEGTSDEAVLRLCMEWGLDAGQAHAVLDLQIKRFGLDGAARLEDEIASLKSDRERLERGEPVE